MKQFIKHTPYLMSLLMLLGITSCTRRISEIYGWKGNSLYGYS